MKKGKRAAVVKDRIKHSSYRSKQTRKLIVTLSVSISFGIQRFVSNEEGESKTDREEREDDEDEEEENELEVDDYEEEEAAESIKNIKEEEEVEEEEEDEESKGVTSKIKSQFANFSVLSLLARKTPDKEEKVRQDQLQSDLDCMLTL